MRERLILTLFAALLIAGGFSLCRAGVGAIRAGSYDFVWREKGTKVQYVDHYEGPAAVLFGVGLAAAGSLLTIPGVMAAAGAVRRQEGHRSRSITGRTLLAIATLSFAVACLAFFPVWQIRSLPFYAVPLAAGLAWFVHRRRWIAVVLAVIGAGALFAAYQAGALVDRPPALGWTASLVGGLLATVIAFALAMWWLDAVKSPPAREK